MPKACGVIKVRNDHPTYREGDFIEGFNGREVLRVHMAHICHPRLYEHNVDGLKPNDGLLKRACDSIFSHRLERVSSNVARLVETDYLGNETSEEFFTGFGVSDDRLDVSNVAGFDLEKLNRSQHISVAEYFRRRVTEGHRVFGAPGAEIYHVGNEDYNLAALEHLWVKIQEHSPHRLIEDGAPCPHCATLEHNHLPFDDPGFVPPSTPCLACTKEHDLFPVGRDVLRMQLVVPLEDFGEEDRVMLQRESPARNAKRAVTLNWRDPDVLSRLGVAIADVENPAKVVDIRRGAPLVRSHAAFRDKEKNLPVPPPIPPRPRP